MIKYGADIDFVFIQRYHIYTVRFPKTVPPVSCVMLDRSIVVMKIVYTEGTVFMTQALLTEGFGKKSSILQNNNEKKITLKKKRNYLRSYTHCCCHRLPIAETQN